MFLLCVGKIALFDKALVAALARGALAMCAMWVGFPSSFLWVGRKKQNKFPSNLHCPVIKLNHFLFQIVTIVSVCSSVALTLVANGSQLQEVGDFGDENCLLPLNLIRSTKLHLTNEPPISCKCCYALLILLSYQDALTKITF